MNVKVFHLIKGAQKARGLTVIIDVFRAFSTACYIYQNEAQLIIPVADLNLAYRLKENNSEITLVGERSGKIKEGFDYSNSPSKIKNICFKNKVVVLTTSSGTKGIIQADKANEIITGSFVNLSAIINYIKTRNPDHVSLVCMGRGGKRRAEEDIQCAKAIKKLLEGNSYNFKTLKDNLKQTAGKRFFNPHKSWFPEEDFHLCLEVDKFNFVMKVEKEAGDLTFLKKIYI